MNSNSNRFHRVEFFQVYLSFVQQTFLAVAAGYFGFFSKSKIASCNCQKLFALYLRLENAQSFEKMPRTYLLKAQKTVSRHLKGAFMLDTSKNIQIKSCSAEKIHNTVS